jgi:hypothetical protein
LIKAAKKFAIKHLEPRFYGALWCVGASIFAAMVILAIADANIHREKIVFLAGGLAIVLATIGWIWSGRMGIIMARKTNALQMLARISGPDVNKIKEIVYPYIEKYEEFKRSDDCLQRPEMPQEQIQTLLGVYEQLSVAVIHGAVDHDIIKASQSMVFKRIYRGLHHHIERTQEKNADYFINFETLTCNWHPELQRKAAVLGDPGGLFAPMRGVDG